MAEKREPAERREEPGAAAPSDLVDPVDAIVATVLVAACAALASVTATFDEVSQLLTQNVAPETFPRILLAIIAGLALLLPFEHRFNRRWTTIRDGRARSVPATSWATLVFLAALGAAAAVLGTVVTIAGICLALPLLWGERRPVRVAVFAAVFTALVFSLFNLVLKVHFEPGLLAAGWLRPG